MSIALKIKKNTKKEQPFENLDIIIDISILDILFLPYECVCFFCFFFWKNGTFMFLNVCLIIRHQHILLQIPFTLRFPIHLSRGFHWCSRKKAVRISERTRPFVIRKNSFFENFWNFPCKTSMRKYSCKPS